MNTQRAVDEIDELYVRFCEFQHCTMEAEKRHVPMIASAYMNICRNSYMSVEELRRVEGNYYHYMPYLSRPGYYAYHPVTKILEDHITSSTKTGTEERKLLVEKRDYTFRLTPLMCAVHGLVNLDGENNAGGGFKHDYNSCFRKILFPLIFTNRTWNV